MSVENELEEEFFRVEGRPVGSAACEYVYSLMRTPNGLPITAKDRATLWYIAYSVRDGIARISLASVASHIDCGVWETRTLLFHLVDCGLLTLLSNMSLEESDVHAYVFPELRKAITG